MFAAAGVWALGLALIWNPFSRVSLEQASVIVPMASHAPAPPPGRGDVMTIIYSGDGGWSDLDKQLGSAFAARGIPVLGINTFKYYWRHRTAEESAAQLDALMTTYAQKWGKPRVWMVGFSFGADVLPTIVGKLSPANRARITQMVLLSPSHDLNFEIELEGYMSKQGWFKQHLKELTQHINPVAHYNSLPPLQALQGKPPVVCYYGTRDGDDSLCDEPGLPPWVTVHALPGGHHFDEGYQALAQHMLDELPAATVSPAGH